MPQPAKSDVLHFVQGTKSQARPAEPSNVHSGRPKPPAHLSEPARIEWKRVSKILGARGTETPGDYAVLAVYCECLARWVEAKKQVAIDGLRIMTTVIDSNGNAHQKTVNHPLLKVVDVCETRLHALTKSLGLTPDSREKVKPAKAEKQEKYAEGTLGWMEEQERLGKL